MIRDHNDRGAWTWFWSSPNKFWPGMRKWPMGFLEPVTRARQGPGLTEMRVLMNLGRNMLVRVGKLKGRDREQN